MVGRILTAAVAALALLLPPKGFLPILPIAVDRLVKMLPNFEHADVKTVRVISERYR